MPKAKGYNLPLIKCEHCDFATKNEYIYRRHKNRCTREHKKKLSTDPEVSFGGKGEMEGEMDSMMGEKSVDNIEQGGLEEDQDELDDGGEVALASGHSLGGNFLPPPLVNRNYRCSQCSYATTKSKMFLYHQIDSHGAKINVFPCQFCEYATKYKHKVRRHIQFAHKEKLAEGRLIPGFEEGGVLGQLEASFKAAKTPLPKEKTAGSLFKKALSRVSLKSKAIKKKPLTQKAYPHVMRMKTASGMELYKCKLCLYSGKNRHQALKHVKACHTGSKTFTCWQCPFKTKNKNEFYLHKTSHGASSAQYQCKECSYATDFKPNFERHMENHNSGRPFKCTLCSYSSGHDGALKRHMSNHHPLTEKNTSIVFGEEVLDVVDNDLENMEEDDEGEEADGTLDVDDEEYDPKAPEGSPPRGSKKHTCCQLCGLSYRRISDLGRHLKTKHNTSIRELRENPMQIENENSDDGFDMDDLDESWASNQNISWKEKAKCKFCSYIAKWPSDLRRHMAVHSVEKRFKCPYCMKKYKYLGDLNVHVRRDHNKEPEEMAVQRVAIVPLKKSSPQIFRCPACSFTTKWKSEMERHSHIHKEEKAYQCRKCDYQTYWRGDIGRHIFRHHADQMPKDTKDVDLKEYMIIRPDRKAVKSKVHGRSLSDSFDEVIEEPPVVMPEPVLNQSNNDDQESDSMSTASSATPQKEHHPNGTPSKCDHCDFVTNAPSKLKAHVATHFNLKQFKCTICGRRSNWKWDVRKHMKKDHPESTADVQTLSLEEAKATIQEYLDTQPNVRREHHFNVQLAAKMEAQSGETKMKKPYQCSLCPFRSDFRWSVSKHLRTIHNGQVGSIIFLKEKDKDKGDGFVPVKKLESSDKLGPPPPPPPTGNKHHDLRAPNKKNNFRQPIVPFTETDEDKPYMCVECGKKGALKGDIKKHYHYIHPNKEVRVIYIPEGTEFLYAGNTTPLPRDEIKTGEKEETSSKKSNVTKDLPVFAEHTKYSDPKTHGYCKPFKCSVCGRRSNWKWDVKKHLRDKHPASGGYVIMLDLKTARETYYAECSPQHGNPMQDIPTLNQLKEENTPITEGDSTGMAEDVDRCKRFKCGTCSYRSNWRTDIGRHVKRRHRHTKTKIILLDVKVAKETLSSYFYERTNREPAPNDSNIGNLKRGPYKKKMLGEMKKVWKCCKCPFEATGKAQIIRHMQKHNMKPFTCILCPFSSNFRSALYRHLRCTHGKTDYPSFTKILIKYGKGFAGGNVQTNMDDFAEPVQQGKTIITEQYVDSYLCRICNFQSPRVYLAYRHLREKHGVDDKNQVLKIRKRQRMEVPAEEEMQPLEDQMADESPNERGKKYMCGICPYKATKRGLLNFHMTYHQPQAVNRYKCKYCPYYVCAPRLLHQHMRLHTNRKNWPKGQKSPNVTPKKKNTHSNQVTVVTPKKHQCQQCPYSSNSKNDMLYHKQFHRPKPTAEFKCDNCDYWVTHRRLLKQHSKIHEDYEKRMMMAAELNLVQSSPCKSEMSDSSVFLDAVEIASLKQRLIGSKITASLSTSPSVSPMKIATQCSVGNRPGYVMKNGSYKKVHKCQFCPYTNIRNRNVKLHEMMHGARKSPHPLMKCPHCDYYVGAKGLLSHHLKVHQQHYVPDFNDNLVRDHALQEGLDGFDDDDRSSDTAEIMQEHKVDTLLEIARFKKYCCEKCPYASAKRSHFERHSELHGSKQRFTCDFCDYSVPSNNLLAQHRKLHMMPNQNLLAAQSLTNLQHLAHVPADVALASALPPIDTKEPITISVIHDHLDLYENAPPEAEIEPKKLYRCDRCPYANVRRDHLLAHLKFHMVKSDLACPYCDYSVSKQYLLSQHIRVHFCPLPELSDWLAQNGQTDRVKEYKEPDISEAIEVAHKLRNGKPEKEETDVAKVSKSGEEKPATEEKKDEEPEKKTSSGEKEPPVLEKEIPVKKEPKPSTSKEDPDDEPVAGPSTDKDPQNVYICQYCEREFAASEKLVRHEMQHLIGNHFEVQVAKKEKCTPLEEPEEKSDDLSNSANEPLPTSEPLPESEPLKDSESLPASEPLSESVESETKEKSVIKVTVEETQENPEEEPDMEKQVMEEKACEVVEKKETEDVLEDEPMETVVNLAADME